LRFRTGHAVFHPGVEDAFLVDHFGPDVINAHLRVMQILIVAGHVIRDAVGVNLPGHRSRVLSTRAVEQPSLSFVDALDLLRRFWGSITEPSLARNVGKLPIGLPARRVLSRTARVLLDVRHPFLAGRQKRDIRFAGSVERRGRIDRLQLER